jgi:hypothetical protein
MRRLLRPLVWLVNHAIVYGSERKRLKGLVVSCSEVDGDCELFFDKIERALVLIEKYDERRLTRMRHDIRAIALAKRGASYFESTVRAVFLDANAFPRASVEAIAASLIHEATHARLFQAGFRNYATNKERHERICIREELAFARRLPDAGDLIQRLETRATQPWWNEEGRQARLAAFVDAYGLPNWLYRLLVRFGAR